MFIAKSSQGGFALIFADRVLRTCQDRFAIKDSAQPGRKAAVAELVDAVDLKSIDPRSCRFDPGRRYFVREVIVKGNAYFDFIDGQFLVGEI